MYFILAISVRESNKNRCLQMECLPRERWEGRRVQEPRVQLRPAIKKNQVKKKSQLFTKIKKKDQATHLRRESYTKLYIMTYARRWW